MHTLSKLFAASGLVIMIGPLCITAQAQGYVDLEAERAAAKAAGRDPVAAAPADPYGVQPAQAYPATSYGVNTASAAPATAAPAPVASAAGGQGTGQNLGNLFYQIQQLQQEVMRMNGRLEEQAHELRTLREQSLERYTDLDKRLSGAGAQPAAGGSSAGTSSTSPATGAPVATPVVIGNRSTSVAEQPGEGEAYRAAYALVQGRQFDQAAGAFRKFLQNYPDGKYAPNAHYWLGELYLVIDPPDLEASRQAFALLVSQYPDNSKAADALYKLGKVQFMKGNREKAREYFDLVISQYGSSNSAVVKLARDFIAENY